MHQSFTELKDRLFADGLLSNHFILIAITQTEDKKLRFF